MENRLVQLNFSVASDWVSHRCMLFKLKYIGAGRQFSSIVLQFLGDRRQRVRLDGKFSVLVSCGFGDAPK